MIFFKAKKRTDEMAGRIDRSRIPAHVAIIMDGNGRWAKKRNLPRSAGHRAGVEAIREIVKTSSKLGIKVLTLYAFSTENWKRPADEVTMLMSLLVQYLRNEVDELDKNNVKIVSIGNISKLPTACREELNRASGATSKNTGLILNLALNYGGRAEITDAVRRISAAVLKGSIKPDQIDEKMISDNLYTSALPDPDLIIRPSGELRLSNFLLWQCAYSEFWFSNVYWPDFNSETLCSAIIDYQSRDRRFGGIKMREGR